MEYRLIKETIQNQAGATIASYCYTYNENGQKVAAREETSERVLETKYTYDGINRLIKEITVITSEEGRTENENITYTYDAVGNRTKKIKNGITYEYEYNNLNQLTKETSPHGEIVYEYDIDGNLIFRGSENKSENYTYSVDGKLLTYKNMTATSTTEEVYTYDGNRLSKEIITEGGSDKTYYVMDTLIGYSQVALELDENKEIKTIYERGDALLSIKKDGEIKTYLADGHGDVRYLTDEEGNITDFYRYSGYGELLEKVGITK